MTIASAMSASGSVTFSFHAAAHAKRDAEVVSAARREVGQWVVVDGRRVASWVPVTAALTSEVSGNSSLVTRKCSGGNGPRLELLVLIGPDDVDQTHAAFAEVKDGLGEQAVELCFNAEGGQRMKRLTSRRVESWVVFLVNDQVRYVSLNKVPVFNVVMLRNVFTDAEAQQFVQGLKSPDPLAITRFDVIVLAVIGVILLIVLGAVILAALPARDLGPVWKYCLPLSIMGAVVCGIVGAYYMGVTETVATTTGSVGLVFRQKRTISLLGLGMGGGLGLAAGFTLGYLISLVSIRTVHNSKRLIRGRAK